MTNEGMVARLEWACSAYRCHACCAVNLGVAEDGAGAKVSPICGSIVIVAGTARCAVAARAGTCWSRATRTPAARTPRTTAPLITRFLRRSTNQGYRALLVHQDHRAINVPLARAARGQYRAPRDTRFARSAPTTAVCSTPSKLVLTAQPAISPCTTPDEGLPHEILDLDSWDLRTSEML